MKRKSVFIISILFLIMIQLNAYHKDFVYTNGGKLMLNGKEFRFTGANNYYLHYSSNEMIDDVFDSAVKMNLKVVRCWAFMDGLTDKEYTMQYAPGKYGAAPGKKDGFERLDYSVNKAKEKGIKLVLVFVNNWNDFGGMQKYCEWFGSNNHDDFYTNPKIKETYKNYIKYLLNRINIYTKKPYKNESAIMTWELTNEARCDSDKSCKTLFDWTAEMSKYVRSLDKKHLIALGDEGFFNRKENTDMGYKNDGQWIYNGNNGVDWEKITALPDIDYGTYHVYPKDWGISEGIRERWTDKYILDHIESGKKHKKPVVLEEYGVRSFNEPENRNYCYELWTNTVFENGGAGSMFWLLTGIDNSIGKDRDGLYPNYDGFRIVKGNIDSLTLDILYNHSLLMEKGKDKRISKIFFTNPGKNGSIVKGLINIKASVITYNNVKVIKVEFIDNSNNINDMTSKQSENDFYFNWICKNLADEQALVKVKAYFSDGSISEAETTVEIKK